MTGPERPLEPPEAEPNHTRQRNDAHAAAMGSSIAIGIALGAGIGVALGNVFIGSAVGPALDVGRRRS